MTDETPPPPAPVVAIEEAVTNRTRWLYVHLCDALGVEPDPGAHHTSWDTAVGRVRIQAEALRTATARAERLDWALKKVMEQFESAFNVWAEMSDIERGRYIGWKDAALITRAALSATEEGQG